MKIISVIIPVYYEELVVEECYKRIRSVMDALENYDYELIFINDGSTDKTFYILKNIATYDRRLKIINLSRNFGHQIAITAGMDRATGDAVVVIDADLQDPPDLIPQMIKKWEEGYKVVYAIRSVRKGESRFKLLSASIFYKLLDKLTDINIPLNTGDFRLMDKRVIQEMRKIRERNRFVRGISSWVGFRQIGIKYERDKRFAGETKYPLRKMIKFAFDGIICFSHKPLELALNIGFISIFVGIIMMIYVFVGKIFFPKIIVPGWASILIAVVFFGGIQLLTIGIIGEYIARIFDETKNRPLYIVEDEINFDK
ncbi:MAG: glycosyltransferase family 2 protein [Promethearchaeota archaeon]